MSYLYSEKGRDYYVCDKCKKPYSFKTGRVTNSGMRDCCRACKLIAYPLSDKEVRLYT